MGHKITTVAELGTLIRATRKSVGARQDDLAAAAGLSKQFVTDLELGKPGVQLGKVLQVMQELGVHVYVDVPDDARDRLVNASRQIGKTTERRAARTQDKLERDPVPRVTPQHRNPTQPSEAHDGGTGFSTNVSPTALREHG